MVSQKTDPIKISTRKNEINLENSATYVNVAVAVIHYHNEYLLGFRDIAQHQGNRYEFVGGKIEIDETAKQALIREVSEETGIEIESNVSIKLGRLYHDYGDKQVCLHVYKVALTTLQYEKHRYFKQGLEGQTLTWVDKSKLLAKAYSLPAANETILDWLRLPEQITITYPLTHFNSSEDPESAWLQYHTAHLTRDAWVYIRLKASEVENTAEQLLRERPDIYAILPDSENHSEDRERAINQQIMAKHLTHSEVMRCSSSLQRPHELDYQPSKSHPLIVSCHNADSIYAANKLARARLHQQLPPVIGIFLSPVLATQTHPETAPLGWQVWSKLAALADMPVIALGGLSPEMSVQAEQYGGTAVAGIRQFFQ